MTNGIACLCQALTDAGIECVFGVPGTQNVQLFEGFRRGRIRTVLTTSELAASFMANGYYRATGKVAVLATIPGPGFTLALTGLAEARHDSVGILYLVGLPATQPGRAFQLQAIGQRAMAAPILKAYEVLDSPNNIASVIRGAHDQASRPEPGPVMVELDLRVLSDDAAPGGGGEPPATKRISRELMDQLTRRFDQSERPVFLLGQGALGAATDLERMANALAIPILTTPSARGIIREDSPLAMGFDPLRGAPAEANRLLDRSDLVLALGCKLSHNGSAGFELRLPMDRLVHVDADPGVLGANYATSLSVVGRVEEAVAGLLQRRVAARWMPDELRLAREKIRQISADQREPLIRGDSAMEPADFFSWLRRALPDDAIVVTDSGLHQILTRRYYQVLSRRGLIFPSDFQSMGFGLPAAVGAKIGAPTRTVVALVGDGGFLMSAMELLTAVREKLPVVTIVFNDGQLNQIRLQQLAEFGHAHAVRLLNPDYRMLAAALGTEYVRFGEATPREIEAVFSGAKSALVEVIVGDSMAMRGMAPVARAKSVARRALTPGLRAWLKNVLRRKGSSEGNG
jgi:acetolactate synthase-1/2/3 large subunit